MTDKTSSDLIDRVQHEHRHLRRLFEDLEGTFSKLAAGEIAEESRDEILESAAEDLAVVLEEMLHHFNQEEEIFFVDIEKRFPELVDDVAKLVADHEVMCLRTRWLQRQLKKRRPEDAVAEDAVAILDVIRAMRQVVIDHTEAEQRIFGHVLKKISPKERVDLLEEMRKI